MIYMIFQTGLVDFFSVHINLLMLLTYRTFTHSLNSQYNTIFGQNFIIIWHGNFGIITRCNSKLKHGPNDVEQKLGEFSGAFWWKDLRFVMDLEKILVEM